MEKLQIIEKENQRVLTTAVLAQEYETTTDVITKNFNRNKERYTNGKHFYCLEGKELKEFKLTIGQNDLSLNKVNKLYLWTERGALLHAKSLNTDRAWEVYDILVETYFKKQVTTTNTSVNDLEKTKLEIQKTRAEAMALNAKNRAFKTLMQSLENKQLSPIAMQVFGLKGLEGIFGVDVGNLLPEVEKTYSAEEVGKMLGISANMVGRIANKNGLKTPEYGRYVADKSKNSDKEVQSFRYNDNGIKVLQELAW